MNAHSSSVPSEWVTEQVEFILSKQLPDGAIVGPNSTVNPYFANVAAIGLIAANTPRSRAGALKWMRWYMSHLNTNASSANVPPSSVFDYAYDTATGALTSKKDFDSVDSYGATALSLAYAAYMSDDAALKAFVTDNATAYGGIANMLNYGLPNVRITSGPDAWLTMAKPSYRMAYTMDNAEVYAGLTDFSKLEAALGNEYGASYYGSWAYTTQNAMNEKLWNRNANNWDWAWYATSDPRKFYPDATAQLWPILYGVDAPTSARAKVSWSQFVGNNPVWYNGVPGGSSYLSVTRVAQLMGANAEAVASLINVYNRYAPRKWTTPTSCTNAPCEWWSIGEAAWFIVVAVNG